MSDSVISVENLSKSYLIGHQVPRERYSSLRDSIAISAKSILRKTRDLAMGKQSLQGDSVEEFWALKDVSFEVKQGEVLGIIGRNGAGKSTLLKVLSRITEPTSGRVTLNGRVASLLEVGTGFHPELTGRENLYLNGAILGMSRKEITRKFDEIVDFAGVEKFLDTPVKRYSSGMYVRLAFAVAAHLEPEILVVDEVLAVGDAEFQKKCMGKMQDVATGGRTVLFVSHAMASISALCTRTILMSNGSQIFDGNTRLAVETYLKPNDQQDTAIFKKTSDRFWLHTAITADAAGNSCQQFAFKQTIYLRLCLGVNQAPAGVVVAINVIAPSGQIVFTSDFQSRGWKDGLTEVICKFPTALLAPNNYYITIGIHIPNIELLGKYEQALSLRVEETGSGMERYQGVDFGVIIAECEWRKS